MARKGIHLNAPRREPGVISRRIERVQHPFGEVPVVVTSVRVGPLSWRSAEPLVVPDRFCVTRIALSAMALTAWNVFWIVKTIRTVRK
ncbi:MAG: hypothetical protein ACYCW6_27205 [Candidatus Xenobia bacterium]